MAIFGVRPRPCSPIEYFTAPETARLGDYVLLNAEHGQTVAKLESGPLQNLPGSGENDLPAIIRFATDEDMEIFHKNSAYAKKAFEFCRERILARGLEMKLVDVEIFFDRSKFIFYFTAPNRIDFRELVKDLVGEYRARIELRQIGVRHETQMTGAIGNCGQMCCCKRYLRKFAPVTIRMAKEQNLFLNPAKISGICGRLLCCLSYEQENYESFNRESPTPGRKYRTDKGLYKIARIDMFKNSISAINEKNEEVEISLEDWKNLHPVGQGNDISPTDKAPAWTKISYDQQEPQ